jgi:hypothetical protein
MNVGDILGHEVLDLSTATTVGCVDDVAESRTLGGRG